MEIASSVHSYSGEDITILFLRVKGMIFVWIRHKCGINKWDDIESQQFTIITMIEIGKQSIENSWQEHFMQFDLCTTLS